MIKNKAKQPVKSELANFADRVTAALAACNMPASATALQREFNARNPEIAVSVHAARKWLMGESIPTQARLRALADILRVSATWLRFDEEAAASVNKPLSAQENMLIQHFRQLSVAQRKHVLALVQSVVN